MTWKLKLRRDNPLKTLNLLFNEYGADEISAPYSAKIFW